MLQVNLVEEVFQSYQHVINHALYSEAKIMKSIYSSESDLTSEMTNYLKRLKMTGLDRCPGIAIQMQFLKENPDDFELRELIDERLQEEELKCLVDPNPFRATNPNGTEGLPKGLFVGTVPESNVPWFISQEVVTNHLLIIGRSGGGKTNLILLLLCQLLEALRHADNI
jgi:hypothetical protein